MSELDSLRKRLARERAARKQAEAILETKALELYEANQSLKAFNTSLEDQIEERTRQLLSKEQQFKMLVDNASDIIFTADEEGYFMMINPVGLKKFGYEAKDIIGTRYVDYIRDDYKEKIFDFYTKIKEDNIQESYLEFPVINAAGKTVWVGQSVTKLMEGDKIYFSAVARDITEKVSNLNALKTVNTRFSALLENLVDGILVEDEYRRVVLSNKAFTRMFKLPFPPEALIGLDCEQLAVDSAGFFVEEESFIQRIEEIIEKQEVVIDEEMATKDGRIFSRNFIPIQIDGHSQGILWYYADITERRTREIIIKRSEEKYRGIMENMELGIMEVDMDDVIVRVYDRFNQMTGYSGDELIGRKAKETLVVKEFIPIVDEQYVNRKQGYSNAYELKLKRKDESEIWVIVSVAPFYDEYGNVIGSIGLHYDITSRKKLEHALDLARKQAVKAQQAEKQFLASMSHEIRTPLNAIIGMTHLLKDTSLQPDQSEYLEVLASSASLLKNLISDILDISKIDAGTIDIQEKAIDTAEIARQLLPTVSLKNQEEKLEFLLDHDDNIRHSIMTDEQLLSQVLLNLLSNSAKFTEEGSVVLKIKKQKETNSHYQLYFCVEDTGIGMSQAEVDQIFEQFTQANPSIRNKYGGTGLGLSISKRLVSLLGGELTATSQKGVGSKFFFTLNVKKGPSLEALDTNTFEVNNKSQQFIGKLALVVEDNEMNIKYLTTLLKKWGIHFHIARNGLEAVAAFPTNDFDIVLMDLQMPVMDGFEASRKIRSMGDKGAAVPIIALTASTFLSKKQLALKAGLSDFVSKPFTPDQLIEVAAKYLTTTTTVESSTDEFVFNGKLDRLYLEKMYGNDLDYAHDMFSTFLEIIDGEFDHLLVALRSEDRPEIKRAAHKIKPTFSMVGLRSLTGQFSELEGSVLNTPVSTSLKQVLAMQEVLNKFRPILEQEKNNLFQQLNGNR